MTPKVKVDRTILSLLPEPDSTPSSQSAISHGDERLHRLHGVSLVYDAVAALLTTDDDDKPTTPYTLFPTAAILFHRFYHRVSFTAVDVWSTAMACTVLAAKLSHQQALPVRDVIAAFQYVLRQRGGGGTATTTNTTRTIDRAWHERLVATEGRVLRELGFVLYWIPEDANPHPYIGPFCEHALQRTKEASVLVVAMREIAHKNCDAALHLDFSVRFPATTIACASVWVAIMQGHDDGGQQQYSIQPHALCSVLCGPEKREAVLSIANGILGVLDANNCDVKDARSGYLSSLCEEGSFNGPGTPSWGCLVENK